jgi:hypothetical protein
MVADVITWIARYGDNVLLVVICAAGVVLNVHTIRHGSDAVGRALRVVAAVGLGYVVVIQAIYIAGFRLTNGWYEMATMALAATLTLNAWVGRDRGTRG